MPLPLLRLNQTNALANSSLKGKIPFLSPRINPLYQLKYPQLLPRKKTIKRNRVVELLQVKINLIAKILCANKPRTGPVTPSTFRRTSRTLTQGFRSRTTGHRRKTRN